MRIIDKIIIHCSATKAGMDFRAADIRLWHKGRGFADIGYHYVIDLDGTLEAGRPIAKVGAHCLGQNMHSIGICYVGGLNAYGKPSDTRTPAQKKTMRELVKKLVDYYRCNVYGHKDFANKACPCFDAHKEYSDLYAAAHSTLETAAKTRKEATT